MVLLKDIIVNKNISIDEGMSLKSAIKKMNQNDYGVIVVLSQNIPIGIITQKDILSILTTAVDLSIALKEILIHKDLITVNIKRSIEYALNIIIDHNIKRVIIVDDQDEYLGIVSQEMLVKNLEDDSFRTNLIVSNFITNKNRLITLGFNDTLETAFKTMIKYNIGSIVIVDHNNEAVGILTQKDAISIANKDISTKLPIKEFMSSPLITVNENDVVKSVIDLMVSKHINQVLVTQHNSKQPLNIISMRDVAHNLKGNYGYILENKLQNVKKTLNYIGELVLEIYEDNNEQVIQWMNDVAIEHFGSSVGKTIYSIIKPSVWHEIYNKIKEQTNCEKLKVSINNMYFEVTCSYHFVNNKETILLILRDISKFEYAIKDANKKSQELQQELEILQSVIDQQNNMVLVTNGSNIISTNKTFYDFFDIKSIDQFLEIYGCLSKVFIQHPDFFYVKDNENWLESISNLHEKNRIVSMIEVKTVDPKVFTVQLNKLNSDPNNYVVTLTDITEIKLESQKYYFNATHDALTKIYNRSYYLDMIKIALDKVKRYNAVFSLILFDIDNFKRLNDTYGHLKGDEVLIALSQAINKNIRTSDIFARWGGEEFVILLPATSLAKAELLAQNLQKIVQNLNIPEVGQVTASFGVTQFDAIDNENTITQRVDEAMYEAKSNGKNQVVSA